MGRIEDDRFLWGAGTYTSDLFLAGLTHAVFVRASVPHARIVSVDVSVARTKPGVLAVFTASDLAADGIPDIPVGFDLRRPDGGALPPAGRRVLAREVVRHLGEPVAIVIAESGAEAADAAEHVAIAYEELMAVTSAREASGAAAPLVWPEAPGNLGFCWAGGNKPAVQAAFRAAAHVSRQAMHISRVAAHPLEVRSALGRIDEAGRMVLHIGHQQPHALRDALARSIFRVAPRLIRVISPDVGGSFGLKTGVHSEEVAVLWAAQTLGRPVRWVASRSEAFLGDDHSRDVDIVAALALDLDGNFLALDVRFDINVGCYLSGRSIASINNVGGVAGVYRIPAIAAEVYGVLTNTNPTGPYRGAGRPEATFAIERIIDIAAREIGRDPFELRRQNLIGSEEMPFKTALTFTYDCGDFAGNMDRAADLADLQGFPARRAEAAARGRLRGIGIANLIESAGGPFGRPARDSATLRVRPDGAVVLSTGALSTGQGVETVLSNLVARRLGVPVHRIIYQSGDTDSLAFGRGSGGSSASGVTGPTVAAAVDALIERARDLAADRLEAGRADLTFSDGEFAVIGTDLRCTLAWLAQAMEADATDLSASSEFQPLSVTFPNGCHVCEVEIDQETGEVAALRYVAVEDVGRVLDPVLVDGQIHGGVAQGLGQALMETLHYEPASGQLITGSFVDYAMPRASDMPTLVAVTRETLTAINALGAKGVGEAGTVGSLVVAINAVCDAIAPLGVPHIDMPASAARIWAIINGLQKTK